MRVESIRTASLGDTSYVVTHSGTGIVVDPQRDLSRFRDAIERLEVEITHVVETHVHNDYVSGARALAKATGADLVLPAGAGTTYAFVPAFHLEDIKGAGAITIRPIHTPGHTPEHCSYLILIDGLPTAVFSGGSLLVGSAGRSDLLGDDYADSLARLQYLSVNRLAELPGDVDLFPTHGAGSFCTASAAGRAASTIETERATNPVLAYPDVEAFVRGELTDLLPYPDYYPSMAPTNRLGPDAIEEAAPPVISAAEIDPAAHVVDMRTRDRYFAGHLAGSLCIEAGDSFAPWVGWLVPFGQPVHLVAGPDDDAAWAVVELGRIGYEVVGITTDLDGADLVTGRTGTRADAVAALADGATVLDVRDPLEWKRGHARGTIHRYLPDLRSGIPGDTDEAWVICRSGYRASIASGLLERAGVAPITVAVGGVEDLLREYPELFESGETSA